ncbi:RNA ligase/cyclic nucleotide phosphodiesterase [Clohesyomyces aquaticus]|uniref:RNA ligase/cyclic nucleotide phosphodiesterase n=1 Tax=Clohesyomyces aquaticus TaxID=1231657 RepID=A0A1Y1ZBA0_9PLEO|nr:RNA ligase/cyclic nucleotide phosphodiesterase [Clohesyomyces aquaticus]
MPSEVPIPVHTSNTFEDLSGISTKDFSNPYDALITACNDNPVQIQERYMAHRAARNAQQKAKMVDENFPGVTIDPILLRICEPNIEPGYTDPRHCLVFWGRPTQQIKDLIQSVQQELLAVAPNMWLMPQDCLHLTVLEMTHSRTAGEIQTMVDTMREKIPFITDYTFEHRARLIKPMIGFDASALALSFVPAAGENLRSDRTAKDEKFTYHHLRRDIYNLCCDTGVAVDSRYVVPSSHLTIGRFIKSRDFSHESGQSDPSKIKALVTKIEEINARLQSEFWPESNGGKIPPGGEWIVGEEKGLNCRMGTLWYGGGESVRLGKGF